MLLDTMGWKFKGECIKIETHRTYAAPLQAGFETAPASVRNTKCVSPEHFDMILPDVCVSIVSAVRVKHCENTRWDKVFDRFAAH